LPIRDCYEESGYLFQLLLYCSEDIDYLKHKFLGENIFTMKIINEQIEIMAHNLLDRLLAKIKAAEHFALIGNETRIMCKW